LKSDISKQSNRKKGKAVNLSWILTIFLMTIVISALMSLASSELLSGAAVIVAFGILLLIVLIGIVFDILGVAVTASDPKPFHSMAAHRVRGAQEALHMLKHAEKVSSFCNDVIGDICGVVSGTASAAICALVLSGRSDAPKWVSVLLAALVSGVTVGGKAVGKTLALNRSTDIVHLAARAVYYVKYLPGLVSGSFRRKGKHRNKKL